MNKIIIINGFIAALVIAGLSSWLLWSTAGDAAHSQSAWLGYLIMVAGLAVIYVAIKQVRDQQCGGLIGFYKGFSIGLQVTLIAAFFYVLSWEFYYQSAGQDFITNYQQSQLSHMAEAGATDAEMAASRKDMQAFAQWYDRWYNRAMVTLFEILPVGLLISVLAAALLRTRQTG
ncbi:DUF4199 domain-containing protein [Marinicella sediminis]|uniref:DUF4199 domain-containing protein n=1 Tax=Marinicella sediminis TaxID=1792834 RepID=A0ABV7JBJ5_9GAMM|nr:DUF4199 domain-containing protein [Marinicella sediminis]